MAKTVKVRIAGAIDSTGSWDAVGWGVEGKNAKDIRMLEEMRESGLSDYATAEFFVEADVELPQEVAGSVEDA